MLGASEAARTLAELAEDDPSEAVRCHAVAVLGRIGDERTVPVLVRLLGSPSRWVRLNAAAALGLLADESAVPAVRAAGRRERFYLRGPYRKAIRPDATSGFSDRATARSRVAERLSRSR
jgi:HEAT repeat protein